ncbi:hypothetical protein ARMSODRAFT_1085034 [Armillaria solidipes]|uniref:Uncharacterized protein n=1 Tax=Armillaria solidipes TaxID=1076256 RepID=A0A2H3BX62_9AGAR|nr:hypothetical protein ARMSODRAFT_1085034 [Armillaria solidipes]
MCRSFSIFLVHSTNSSFLVRRVFLDTSPDLQVEDLKRRLKVAEDRLEIQSTSHALAIARLTQQLELEATKTRRENDRAALLEMIHYKRKYESLRDDFFIKSSSSPLSSVTVGVKRQRSDSSGDLDQERASPLPSLSRPPPMRSPTATTPTMRPLRQPVDLSTFMRLREALEKARQTLQGPFPTFDELPSDRTNDASSTLVA